jgi:hypothetical protein
LEEDAELGGSVAKAPTPAAGCTREERRPVRGRRGEGDEFGEFFWTEETLVGKTAAER